MSDENPFLAPTSTANQGSESAARSVDAGRAVDWLRRGWQAFVRDPAMWLAITVVFAVIYIAMSIVPILGNIAAALLVPVFLGGIMLGCQSAAGGGELRLDHLFAGFKQRTQPLIMLGVYYLVGCLIIVGVTFLVAGGSAITGAVVGRVAGAGLAAGGFFLGMLVALALAVPLSMALWFAPALVILRGDEPLDAMKGSFFACLANILPFLVYGLIMLVALFAAMIPFALGMLVWLPVLFASVYAAYVDILE